MTQLGSTVNYSTKQNAFTLIEMLVSLIIITIVLAMALPNVSTLLLQNRMDTLVTEFSQALYLARSESIKRAVNVTVCSSVNGVSCTTATGWQSGWIVFADSNASNDLGVDEERLRVYQNPHNGFTLVGNTYVTSQINYLPTGRISVLGGTINVCSNDRSQLGKNIVLIATGRFRIDTDIACE